MLKVWAHDRPLKILYFGGKKDCMPPVIISYLLEKESMHALSIACKAGQGY